MNSALKVEANCLKNFTHPVTPSRRMSFLLVYQLKPPIISSIKFINFAKI